MSNRIMAAKTGVGHLVVNGILSKDLINYSVRNLRYIHLQ
jgi:hypothetical protein